MIYRLIIGFLSYTGLYLWVCVAVLFLSGCTNKTYNTYYTIKGETKVVVDTVEVSKLKAENKKLRYDLYWTNKKKNQALVEVIALKGLVKDTTMWPKMRFDKNGNCINKK